MTHSDRMGVNMYCIRNKQGHYWDNDWGWIELEDEEDEATFSVFTTKEKQEFNLPVGGHWELM